MRHILFSTVFLIFLSANGFAIAAEQDDRISDMGFVSVTEEDADDEAIQAEFIERRVPQPKVVNFPTDRQTDFRGEDTSIRVSPQPFIRTDVDTVPGFYELGNPILVGPGEQAVVVAPPEPEIDERVLEQEFMAAAIEVLGDKSGDTVTRTAAPEDMVVQASQNGFYVMDEEDDVAVVGPHRDQAYNFYTYNRRDRKFFPWRFGQGRENPFGLTAKQQREVEKATHKDLMRGTRIPESEWKFKNQDAKRGIPGIEGKLSVTAGYRLDSLEWNKGFANMTPNILSELTWDGLQIWEYKARAEVVFLDRFVFDAKAGWGQIWSGENQDSDYLGDDRTLEFSRSNNTTDDGEVWDYSIAGGYRIQDLQHIDYIFIADELDLTLLGGYSRHAQYLVITDGMQTIPDAGPFGFLNSRYRALWDGPWVGIQLDGKKGDRLTGYGRFEYHWLDYEGDGTWNLRTDRQQPVSFSHFAGDDDFGLVFDLGGEYRMNPTWSFALDLVYTYYYVGKGIDRNFFVNGNVTDIQFNEAVWTSFSISGGVLARF